jgi:hypothetical protein
MRLSLLYHVFRHLHALLRYLMHYIYTHPIKLKILSSYILFNSFSSAVHLNSLGIGQKQKLITVAKWLALYHQTACSAGPRIFLKKGDR